MTYGSRAHRVVAMAAALWALSFGVVHLCWAVGQFVGLDPVAAREAFARPWMRAYNAAVIVACALGVPIALALAMPWGRALTGSSFRGSSFRWLAIAGTGLLVLRAIASLVQATICLTTGGCTLREIGRWEPWFYLGAALFVLDLMPFLRARSAAATAPSPDDAP